MCFSSGSSDSDIARQQRADEVARQARITQGMASINAAFDGTKKGVNAATSYDPSKSYFNADGTAYDATKGPAVDLPYGGSVNLPSDPNADAAAGRLFTDSQQTGGFGEDFYKKQAQNYVDYATPDLERQTKQAHDNMIYALSRTGNLDSSAAIKENNDLNTDADTARIDVANKGQDYANQSRSNVESTRSGLVSELNATGDSSAAAQGAIRQAYNLNVPQAYSPLGQVFANFAAGTAAIGSNAGNGYSGFFNPGKGLFAPSASSSRVVGG